MTDNIVTAVSRFLTPELVSKVASASGFDPYMGQQAMAAAVPAILSGLADLAGKPAVVDIPVGRGHVVMFANNPMWRHETQGSFFLIFNAALNYDHLGAGRTPPPRQNERPDDDFNYQDNDTIDH